MKTITDFRKHLTDLCTYAHICGLSLQDIRKGLNDEAKIIQGHIDQQAKAPKPKIDWSTEPTWLSASHSPPKSNDGWQ